MSDVRHFGATGNGEADDTEGIRHAVEQGDGVLHFSPGEYRISRTIEVRMGDRGPLTVSGEGGASRVVMTGPGPAFRIVGTHEGTGDPGSVRPAVWERERLPAVRDLVLEGGHPDADGIELDGTMQVLLAGLLVRRFRHGVRLVRRNRNVLLDRCHIYHNTGTGVFLDGVNLHQINLTGNHISYNRLGGIRIERSEVRNLQITGNDIEYNNARAHPGLPDEPTAEIWIDVTAPGASVNEVAIASNTIQATVSEGGANLRILDRPGQDRPPGLWTITGNVIGSQENNVHLTGVHGVVISGNCIYSCGRRNLLVEDSRQVTIGTNLFRRHTPAFGTGVRLAGSSDCVLTGCVLEDESESGQAGGVSLLEIERCRRINVQGCQFLDGAPFGIDVADSSDVLISGCSVLPTGLRLRASSGSIRFRGAGSGNLLHGNRTDPAPVGAEP